jgi:16S rRNA (cytosine1402-N4)-methyltransferase
VGSQAQVAAEAEPQGAAEGQGLVEARVPGAAEAQNRPAGKDEEPGTHPHERGATEPHERGATESEDQPTPSAREHGLPASGHTTVLLEPVLNWLQPRGNVGFRALDATLGSGGHSFGLLERSSPDGQLVALDADAEAIERARPRLALFGERFTLLQRNFRELQDLQELQELQLAPVDAIVFDLGLSSVQLEASGRGFSFRFQEPLDMRFDARSGGPTAADLVNELPEAELERIFRDYGEERKSRRLAHLIAQRRNTVAYQRTDQLVETVIQAVGPQRGRIHPATRAFQALRIAVNDELTALELGLDAAVRLLRPGGRLAVISFHSLEDRIVKWRFRGWAESGLVRILTPRPLQPDEDEIRANPRARSAKLRVAERAAT